MSSANAVKLAPEAPNRRQVIIFVTTALGGLALASSTHSPGSLKKSPAQLSPFIKNRYSKPLESGFTKLSPIPLNSIR